MSAGAINVVARRGCALATPSDVPTTVVAIAVAINESVFLRVSRIDQTTYLWAQCLL
jgi:hypothetical protein